MTFGVKKIGFVDIYMLKFYKRRSCKIQDYCTMCLVCEFI